MNSNGKATDIASLKQAIIDAAIESTKTYVWDYIYKWINSELTYEAHPTKWVAEVFNNLTMQNVIYNDSDASVHFNIVANVSDEYEQIKAKVIDEGNQQHGALWTEPGRVAYTNDLDDIHHHQEQCKGRPAIWVHNTNYPNAYTDKTYKYKRKKGNKKQVVKTYHVKMSKFYPIFVYTKLPEQFNRTGIHILQNALKLADTHHIDQIFDDGIVQIMTKQGYDPSLFKKG